jgi:hypothetical protein
MQLEHNPIDINRGMATPSASYRNNVPMLEPRDR